MITARPIGTTLAHRFKGPSSIAGGKIKPKKQVHSATSSLCFHSALNTRPLNLDLIGAIAMVNTNGTTRHATTTLWASALTRTKSGPKKQGGAANLFTALNRQRGRQSYRVAKHKSNGTQLGLLSVSHYLTYKAS